MSAAPADSQTAEPSAVAQDQIIDDDEDTHNSYKGFGSFHSENVQDLIALSDADYVPPNFVVPGGHRFASRTDALTALADVRGRALTWEEALPHLGHALRASHYCVDPSWTFVNHGAFGGAFKAGIAIKRAYEDMMEVQPLSFIDRALLPLLVYSTRAIAKFIGANPKDVAVVSNATFGLNAAINAVLRHETDLVAYLDTEYGSVWKMIRERCNTVGCSGHEIALSKHFLDADVIGSDAAVTAYIESQLPKNCTVFVVDHVASTSAVSLPIFTHIIPMLKRNGVKHIVVDGAHGPLQHHLDFEALTEEQLPSAYVGNLHKWVSCPKSVGFIWTRPDVQKRMHSPVVSHGSRAGYLSEFIWDGTKDYGAYLAIPAVLDFWSNTLGVENCRRYCSELMSKAEETLCTSWGTSPVPRGSCFMKLVQLPEYLQSSEFSSKFIQDALFSRFRVEVPVKNVNGMQYVRISAFVNNEPSDYERLRDSINELVRALQLRKRARPSEQKANGRQPSQPSGSRVDCGGCGVLAGGVKPAAFSDSDDE